MAEFKTSLADERSDTLVYRPISGLAIASVIVAAVYALIVSVLTAIAVYYGDPLPLGTWSLLVPATAAVLGLLARRQIRLSEGTRSGWGLASVGWWLSLVFGLGYAAFYVGTYLAITWQAQAFCMRFFDNIREGKINHAFLLTQAPDQREGVNPDNNQLMMIRFGTSPGGTRKSGLGNFQSAELVRLLRLAGKDAKIQDLGVNSWNYDKGYHILQSFRITMPEGDADVTVSVRSSEDRKSRGWRISWQESDMTAGRFRPTPFGEALAKWRQSSKMFAFVWLAKRASGNFDLAYLETLEPAESQRLLRDYQSRGIVGDTLTLAGVVGIAGQDSFLTHLVTLVDREWRWRAYLPGYGAFAAGSLVDVSKLEAPANYRDEIVKEAKRLMTYGTRVQIKPSEGNTGIPLPFDTATKRLRILHNVDVDAADVDPTDPNSLKFHCEGQLVVESDAGEFTAQRTPQWRIVSLNLLTGDEPAPDPQRQGPGAPGGGQPARRGIKAIPVPN